MPYTAEISRNNPSLVIFLIDQSRSMGERLGSGDDRRTKAQCVADALNRLLQNLVIKAAKSDGVRDYFWVSAIGYGHPVGSVLSKFPSHNPVPISKIADSPLRLEQRVRSNPDGESQQVKFPVWIDPKNHGWTHMCAAFQLTRDIVQAWARERSRSFPPLIFNLTDGGATDGDPSLPAQDVMSAVTEDGPPLIFNMHISSHNQQSIKFPDSPSGLPEAHAERLFRASSTLPESLVALLQATGEPARSGSRAMVYNADLGSVISLLNIGTSAAHLAGAR